DRQARDLPALGAAETPGDDFLDVVLPVRLALLVAPDGAAARQVEPAVVQQNARREFVFEDDLRPVVHALAAGVAQRLDDVLDALLHGRDVALRAVLVDDRLGGLAPLLAGAGPPFEDER